MQIGLDFNLVEDLVAGVDEVGRGPLCGAVVTAAVILDPNGAVKNTIATREKLRSCTISKVSTTTINSGTPALTEF